MNRYLKPISIVLVFFTVGIFAQTNWTKYAGNPVLIEGTSGTWGNTGVSWPNVIKDNDTLKMWYSGRDGNYNWTGIGYATSVNGINWVKDVNSPVMSMGPVGTWDAVIVSGCCVRKDGNQYQMWYSGRDTANWRIGYATSTDGINWTKYINNPVLDVGGSGSWDEMDAWAGAVIMDNSLHRM